MPADTLPLTVGIATRNRPKALERCLASLALIDDVVTEIIVVDDASDPPAREILPRVQEAIRRKIRVIELPGGLGYIAGRNQMMQTASNDAVLMLDDDAYIIDAGAVRRAAGVLGRHADVAAVACAQAEADGSPWPAAMQPAPATYGCYVTAYIGCAALIRRRVFVDLGGYHASFFFYGEEKDYCLRALNAGYHIVYLPDALVAHVPDASGRSDARYLRYVVRNDCLSALYNEPFLLALLTVPVRLARYAAMRRHGGVDDPDGLRWIVSGLVAAWPDIGRTRKPVRWASIRRWRRLKRTWPAFEPHAAGSS
jgi:GT2 family glycosyltransferase